MSGSLTIIAHISDLHFGDASPNAVAALIDDLERRKPDIIVITGDITQEGRKTEFEQAREFLSSLHSPVMVVPGNHDLPVRNLVARFLSPYARFVHFTGSQPNSVYSTDCITIAGLNSARPAAFDFNWSYGRLSERQIDDAEAILKSASSSSLKAIALHHPLTLGPGRAGARVVGRGNQALERLTPAGLDVAFSGHVHHSMAEIVDAGDKGVVVIRAGTATSHRTRNELASYNFISATKTNISVKTLRLQENRFTEQTESRFSRDENTGWRLLDEQPLRQGGQKMHYGNL